MPNLKSYLTIQLKSWSKHVYDFFDARGHKWISENPFRNDPPHWKANPESTHTLGIIKEFWHLHWRFIAACRDLGVSYKVLDISGADWMQVILSSGCDAFLAHPSVQFSPWKEMYDERLLFISRELGKFLFPDYESLWLWENKRRTAYWLDLHNIDHPRTWVFYDRQEAIRFAASTKFPIVYKSNMGSGSSGVRIIRNAASLKRLIQKCFQKGYTTYRKHVLDREVGFILLQEYLADIREWRIVRVGDSFFGYEKVRVGDFHSGSHQFKYGRPPDRLLSMAKHVTDIGGFRSMDVDVFWDENADIRVNELQAIFGQAGSREICRIDGVSGRMVFHAPTGNWIFEPGTFCQNYLCNLRVNYLIDLLDKNERIS